LVQIGQAQDFYQPPFHPYTEALLSAIPWPDPSKKMKAIRLEGEIPGPIDRPPGCPFHPRCPRSLGEICVERAPEWQTTSNNSQICCHIPIETLRVNQKVMSHSAPSDESDQGLG
jgi:peptide/nickel transport system ATP-binding protein